LYFSIRALNVGVSVIAATVEVMIVTVTLSPSCLKRTPVRPSTNVSGKIHTTVKWFNN
jgi:hypothetical protein